MKKDKLKKNKYNTSCLAILLAISMVLTSGILQERTLYENPLGQPADSMLYLQAEMDSSAEKEEQPPKEQEEEEQPPEEQEKEQPLEEEEKEQPSEEEEEEHKKQSEENRQDEESSASDDDGDSQGNEGEGDGEDESGTPSGPGATDIIYFTTSIQDGATLTTKNLEFSINHKIDTLTPLSTQIYVNGVIVEDSSDARTSFSIYLNEGENTVRVQVTYEDEDRNQFAPYKDYTINVDTRNLVINTSLVDGETASDSQFTFTASASIGQENVDIYAMHDGTELSEFDGEFETVLQEGENVFTLSAYYGQYEVNEKYTVYYESPRGMYIETDLQNQTVNSESGEFTFKAWVVDGSDQTEFTVSFNNKVIQGNDGVYTVTLKPQGETAYNTIRLRAKDGTQEDSQTYKIKFIPLATPETEPQISYINISDGQSIKRKNPFTLELAAVDYQGNKIYYDGIEVSLNGSHQILRDTKPYITYKLNFVEGNNLVKIKVIDDDGRIKEFVYNIDYQQPDSNEKIGTVRVIVDANVLGFGTLIDTNMDLMATDNLASLATRAIQAKGYECNYTGSYDSGWYLASIGRSGIGSSCSIPEALKQEIIESGISFKGDPDNPDRKKDTLGEGDYTTPAGWMILVDGHFISESASTVDLKDGSVVRIRFSLAWGMDIGGTYQGMTFENTY